jgi:hypothetical protein
MQRRCMLRVSSSRALARFVWPQIQRAESPPAGGFFGRVGRTSISADEHPSRQTNIHACQALADGRPCLTDLHFCRSDAHLSPGLILTTGAGKKAAAAQMNRVVCCLLNTFLFSLSQTPLNRLSYLLL